MLVSISSYIACISDSRELTADEIVNLHDYLIDAESKLNDVVTAIVGYVFVEVGE